MKEIIKTINDIKSTTKRLEKEKILKQNKDNELLKTIFKFVYDPLVVTGLSKRKIEKKVNTPINHNDIIHFESLEHLMNYVSTYNTGTDETIFSVQQYINSLDTDQKELVKNIIIKDLPIGISRTTLNKIYGKNFINKYSVMLAGKYDEEKHDLSQGFSVTLKLDGNRVTAFNFDSGVKFFARSGKEIEGLDELKKEFEVLPTGMVYDGELLADNVDNLKSKDLFNLTQTIVRRKGTKTGVSMIVFDALPIDEFNKGKSSKIYQERMKDLDAIFTTFRNIHKVKLIPILYTGKDKNVIEEILKDAMANDEEGLMINLSNGYYETKRSKSLLKVKKFTTLDLRCIGVKEDIRGGKCGSITVDYKGYPVDVSGLKDRDKVEFWKNPDSVIGKIIEVKYKDESKNASGGLSLRHPNFIRIRDDKDEVSYA